jgi:hypothetical protein
MSRRRAKTDEYLRGTVSHRRTESDYLAATLDVVSEADWQDVIRATLRAAKDGDAAARLFLAQYLLGRPAASAPSPLTVIVQQMTGDDPLIAGLAKSQIDRLLYPFGHDNDDLKAGIKAAVAAELARKLPLPESAATPVPALPSAEGGKGTAAVSHFISGEFSMGGAGSGRRWGSGRDTTNRFLRLDVRWLNRSGFLRPGRLGTVNWSRGGGEPSASIGLSAGADHVTLEYRQRSGGGEWVAMRYPVRLDWTACHLGGRRPWFLCPAAGCGRRVAILYGGAVFACRRCLRLAYACQSEDAASRAIRRADRLRDRLGWQSGIINPAGGKPKWMRWRTFDRLVVQHEEHVARSVRATLALPLMRRALARRTG